MFYNININLILIVAKKVKKKFVIFSLINFITTKFKLLNVFKKLFCWNSHMENRDGDNVLFHLIFLH